MPCVGPSGEDLTPEEYPALAAFAPRVLGLLAAPGTAPGTRECAMAFVANLTAQQARPPHN